MTAERSILKDVTNRVKNPPMQYSTDQIWNSTSTGFNPPGKKETKVPMSDKKFRGNGKFLNQCCRVLPHRSIEFQTNAENAIGLVSLNIQKMSTETMSYRNSCKTQRVKSRGLNPDIQEVVAQSTRRSLDFNRPLRGRLCSGDNGHEVVVHWPTLGAAHVVDKVV